MQWAKQLGVLATGYLPRRRNKPGGEQRKEANIRDKTS